MKVNFVGGPYYGTSGFSSHLHGLALATKLLNKETSYEGSLPQDWQKNTACEEEFELLSTPSYLDGWQVLITPPVVVPFKYVERNKGILPFMIFEGDKAPKQWVSIAEQCTAVLCPSLHNKAALVAAGIPESKICVVPHGHDPKTYNVNVLPHPLFQSNKFTFSWNKGWSKGVNDRSAFHAVLRAFVEEFHNEPEVRLLAHINPAYSTPAWNLDAEITKLNLELLKTKKCEIVLNAEAFPPSLIAQFYKSTHCFLGTSLAEAFNLPVLEAMACGLPVITTAFGGMTDYVPKQGNIIIKGQLMPALINDINDLPSYEQANWMMIPLDDLKKAMREMYELWKNNKNELANIGLNNAKSAQAHTWQASAENLINLITQLEH